MKMKKMQALRRLLAEARTRRLLIYTAAVALLVGGLVIAGKDLARDLSALEAWIDGLGPFGIAAFACLFVLLTSLLVPESVLAIIAGALFGLRGGLTIVFVSTLLAASLQYALSRRLLAARIEQVLATQPTLRAIQQAVHREQIKLQIMLRLTPVNPGIISYLLGAAGVRFPGFLLACLALTPHVAAEVYLGYASKNVVQMVGRADKAILLHDILVFSGVAVSIGVVLLLARIAHKAVIEGVVDSD